MLLRIELVYRVNSDAMSFFHSLLELLLEEADVRGEPIAGLLMLLGTDRTFWLVKLDGVGCLFRDRARIWSALAGSRQSLHSLAALRDKGEKQ
jgi:hypothetical protein